MKIVLKKIFGICATLIIVSATVFCFYKTQTFYHLYEEGQRLFLAGKDSRALPFLKGAFARMPEDTNTAWYLIWSYERLGRYKDARKILEKLKKNGVQTLDLYEHLGDMYYDENNYSAAEEIYGLYLDKAESQFIRSKYIEVIAWQKKYDDALNQLVDYIIDYPTDNRMRELKADILAWDGRFDQAVDEYKMLIRVGVNRKKILSKLADTLRYAGRDEEAVDLYNEYLRGGL